MKFDFEDVLFAFSYGLDCVENSVAQISIHHSKRVAYLVFKMAEKLGMGSQEQADLAGCALLHDNALSEYLREEGTNNKEGIYAGHCSRGEENIKAVPFVTDITGVILYHHENADGSGTFQKRAEETPMGAQLIHLADVLDVNFNLSSMDDTKWETIENYLKEQKGKEFSEACIQVFQEVFLQEDMDCLREERLNETLRKTFPRNMREYKESEVRDICRMFAKIIDYKSGFTTLHSMGVAQKAEEMALYYGYEPQKALKLYFAGAVHDVGKLIVDTDILEKPARLTPEEYHKIQNHAQGTYDILKQIEGLEEIRDWAALHHEKLNGTGYPFGKKAEELTREERLMACIDIYQALTEQRPYKSGMSHEKTIGIMKKMAEKGEIDGTIVKDMEQVFQTGVRS